MRKTDAVALLLAISAAAPARAEIAATPGAACALAGSYRYTPSGGGLICDGAAWQNLISVPGGDPSIGVAIGAGVLANNAPQGSGNEGLYNIGVGGQVLHQNTAGYSNTGVGYQALLLNSTGAYNSAFGTSALSSNSVGSANTAIGTSALLASTGSYNVALGTNALFANASASHNTAVGYAAGVSITSGSGNVLLGEGGNITTGDGNVLVGNNLSGTEPEGSAQLDVADLLFGIIGGGRVGIGTRAYGGVGLTVNGTAWAARFMPVSDDRLYEDVRPLRDSLDKISAIRGVSYRWRAAERREVGQDLVFPSSGPQLGVIAQDIERVFPEAVETTQNGIETVNYNALLGPMIEAIKVLRHENEFLTVAVALLGTCVATQFILYRNIRRSIRSRRQEEHEHWHSGLTD